MRDAKNIRSSPTVVREDLEAGLFHTAEVIHVSAPAVAEESSIRADRTLHGSGRFGTTKIRAKS
jgi:hypothetical protein